MYSVTQSFDDTIEEGEIKEKKGKKIRLSTMNNEDDFDYAIELKEENEYR